MENHPIFISADWRSELILQLHDMIYGRFKCKTIYYPRLTSVSFDAI